MVSSSYVHTADLELFSMDFTQFTTPSSPLNKTVLVDKFSPLISDEITNVIHTVFHAIICAGICCFGVIANIVNMIVFAKQGFQETVNVTLFAMSASDFASTLTLLWVGICINPFFRYSDIPFIPEDFLFISGIWPHHVFVRITGWLTALVALERCFCVIFPLKVKIILTLTRVKAIVVTIFILVSASFVPSFYATRMVWVFVSSRNKTMLGLRYISTRAQIESVASTINSTVPSICYFTIILASTGILVVNLKQKTIWRQKVSANLDKDQQTVVKDKKAIRLVIAVASIFIICLLPTMMVIIGYSLDPELSPLGKRKNLLRVIGSVALTIEAINSSVNIIIYYKMSSKYKLIFQQIFRMEIKVPESQQR